MTVIQAVQVRNYLILVFKGTNSIYYFLFIFYNNLSIMIETMIKPELLEKFKTEIDKRKTNPQLHGPNPKQLSFIQKIQQSTNKHIQDFGQNLEFKQLKNTYKKNIESLKACSKTCKQEKNMLKLCQLQASYHQQLVETFQNQDIRARLETTDTLTLEDKEELGETQFHEMERKQEHQEEKKLVLIKDSEQSQEKQIKF